MHAPSPLLVRQGAFCCGRCFGDEGRLRCVPQGDAGKRRRASGKRCLRVPCIAEGATSLIGAAIADCMRASSRVLGGHGRGVRTCSPSRMLENGSGRSLLRYKSCSWHGLCAALWTSMCALHPIPFHIRLLHVGGWNSFSGGGGCKRRLTPSAGDKKPAPRPYGLCRRTHRACGA